MSNQSLPADATLDSAAEEHSQALRGGTILNKMSPENSNIHQTVYIIVTIIAGAATVVLAIVSLINSCDAKKTAENIKAEAERINIHFQADFDDKEIELVSGDSHAGDPIIKFMIILSIFNSNPYRPIFIEKIYPTLTDNSERSDLSIDILGKRDGDPNPLPFSISSGNSICLVARISWPTSHETAKFVKDCQETVFPLKTGNFKYRMGEHPELHETQKLKKFSLK